MEFTNATTTENTPNPIAESQDTSLEVETAPTTDTPTPGSESSETENQEVESQKPEDPKASRIIALKHKAARKLQQERAALAKERQEWAAKIEQAKAWEQAKQNQDALAALQSFFGVDSPQKAIEQFNEFILSNGVPKEPTVEDKVTALEKQLKEKEQQERSKALELESQRLISERQEALNGLHSYVEQVITEDQFPVIASLGLHKEVVDLMVASFDENQVLPTPQDAAQVLEDFHFDRLKKLNEKNIINRLFKIDTPKQQAEVVEGADEKEVSQDDHTAMFTLSNDFSSDATEQKQDDSGVMNDDELDDWVLRQLEKARKTQLSQQTNN